MINAQTGLRTGLFLMALTMLAGCASQSKTTWPKAKEMESAQLAPHNEPAKGEAVLQAAAAKGSAPFEGRGWKSLFDGRTLAGWTVTDFSGHGAVACEKGLLVMEPGASLSGVNSTNEVPRMNYEVALDAMKLDGTDFFCGLTFPVGDSYCSLILGGWGGTLTGLSSIDDLDASENETTDFVRFETGRWYRVRVRVTEGKIEAWLDDKKVVNLPTMGHKIGLRFGEIEFSKPLGIATYQTRAAVREIKVRKLESGERVPGSE